MAVIVGSFEGEFREGEKNPHFDLMRHITGLFELVIRMEQLEKDQKVALAEDLAELHRTTFFENEILEEHTGETPGSVESVFDWFYLEDITDEDVASESSDRQLIETFATFDIDDGLVDIDDEMQSIESDIKKILVEVRSYLEDHYRSVDLSFEIDKDSDHILSYLEHVLCTLSRMNRELFSQALEAFDPLTVDIARNYGKGDATKLLKTPSALSHKYYLETMWRVFDFHLLNNIMQSDMIDQVFVDTHQELIEMFWLKYSFEHFMSHIKTKLFAEFAKFYSSNEYASILDIDGVDYDVNGFWRELKEAMHALSRYHAVSHLVVNNTLVNQSVDLLHNTLLLVAELGVTEIKAKDEVNLKIFSQVLESSLRALRQMKGIAELDVSSLEKLHRLNILNTEFTPVFQLEKRLTFMTETGKSDILGDAVTMIDNQIQILRSIYSKTSTTHLLQE